MLGNLFPDFEEYRSHIYNFFGKHTSEFDKISFLLWKNLEVQHENQILLKDTNETMKNIMSFLGKTNDE